MAVFSCQRLSALLSLTAVALAQATSIPMSAPADAGVKLPPGFLAFSIEFTALPAFSGTSAAPNTFTQNLMSNLGRLQGTLPIIRSGGNTQDYIYFDPTYNVAEPLTDPTDPNRVTIGTPYFDSFKAWPKGTQFSYGFNLKNDSAAAQQNMVDAAVAACKSIPQENLAFWEMGNEPDLYHRYTDMKAYVTAWQSRATAVQEAVAKACPGFSSVGFLGPSFSGPIGAFNETAAFEAGLNAGKNIKMVSSHNYIDGANKPGVTMQGTLLNHDRTKASVKSQTDMMDGVAQAAPGVPYILGEANSLYNGGTSGLSNAFGAAIWTVDFALHAASQGIQRIHFHQGEMSPYNAWNPRPNARGPQTTFAPYYGTVAITTFLGTDPGVQVVDFPQPNPQQSVYGAYVDGSLKRMAVLNMNTFAAKQTGPRPSLNFTLDIQGPAKSVSVQRMQAAGSDATTGVTFNGFSYDYAAGQGKPVNVAKLKPETIPVDGGAVQINVPSSEVAILEIA